jgi:hypothetical protein
MNIIIFGYVFNDQAPISHPTHQSTISVVAIISAEDLIWGFPNDIVHCFSGHTE